MARVANPLKWHGGKRYLADWIVGLMPPHTHYVEPYFGGGSVLLAKPLGASEVVNDLNGDLINFWRTLQDERKFSALHRKLLATPFSQDEYERSDVSDAAGFFVRCRQSMAGRMEQFTPLTKRRTHGGRNADANAWINAIDGLPEVHARLRAVVILQQEATKVIRSQDGENTLFYCDPPYLQETRSAPDAYSEFEVDDEGHQELLKALGAIKGSFMLSGYRSDMYDEWAERNGYIRHECLQSSAASGTGAARRECLWVNYAR